MLLAGPLLLLQALILNVHKTRLVEESGDPARDLSFLDTAILVNNLSHRLAGDDKGLVNQTLAVVRRRRKSEMDQIGRAIGMGFDVAAISVQLLCWR